MYIKCKTMTNSLKKKLNFILNHVSENSVCLLKEATVIVEDKEQVHFILTTSVKFENYKENPIELIDIAKFSDEVSVFSIGELSSYPDQGYLIEFLRNRHHFIAQLSVPANQMNDSVSLNLAAKEATTMFENCVDHLDVNSSDGVFKIEKRTINRAKTKLEKTTLKRIATQNHKKNFDQEYKEEKEKLKQRLETEYKNKAIEHGFDDYYH